MMNSQNCLRIFRTVITVVLLSAGFAFAGFADKAAMAMNNIGDTGNIVVASSSGGTNTMRKACPKGFKVNPNNPKKCIRIPRS